MCLVVISHIKKMLFMIVLAEQVVFYYVLKPDDVTESLGTVTEIVLKQSAQLPAADAGVEVLFNINYAFTLKNDLQGFIKPCVIVETKIGYSFQKELVKSSGDLFYIKGFIDLQGNKLCQLRNYTIQLCGSIGQLGSAEIKDLWKYTG